MMFRESPCQEELDFLIMQGGCQQLFMGNFLHENPRFYKYYFWIYHRETPIEGRGFFDNRYRLPIKQAYDLIDQLEKANEPCIIFNQRIPRWDSVLVQFDRNST